MNVFTRPSMHAPVVDIGVPLLITATLSYLSSNNTSITQDSLAFLLCLIPLTSYRHWLRGDRDHIPLFSLLSTMSWVAYAVPLFWAQHAITGVFGRRMLPESAVTESLVLALLGVGCLWLGMRLAGHFHWLPKINKDVSQRPSQMNYLRIVFVLGTLVKIFVPITALGTGARQILSNFENIVPVVSFAIFVRQYLRGALQQVDKMLIAGYVVIAVIVGISSGWLGSAVSIGLVCIVIYVYERRRFPMTAALVVLPLILFFQPAKNIFRERYWVRQSEDSSTQRVGFWVENSWRLWNDALSNQDDQKMMQLANSTLSRFDLLRQTAHVIEFTPDRVPYQYGSLYSYIGVTFIPRFFWPDKPSVNDANRWYQVKYGLTYAQDLTSVSIAVGTVAESYINFGWFGPLLVIFPLGVFLGSFERMFLHSDSGLLFSCIGAVLIPQLLTVEAQMAEYVSGLAQQIALVLLVLIPTLERRTEVKQLRRLIPISQSVTGRISKSNSIASTAATISRGALRK